LQGELSDIPEGMKAEVKSAQQFIACLEALAQIALVRLRLSVQRLQGRCIRVQQFTDSSSAMGAINKLFSTKLPLSRYLWLLVEWAICHQADIRLSHISGQLNDGADILSRSPDPCSSLPLDPSLQFERSTRDLFTIAPGVKLFPQQAHCPPASAAWLPMRSAERFPCGTARWGALAEYHMHGAEGVLEHTNVHVVLRPKPVRKISGIISSSHHILIS